MKSVELKGIVEEWCHKIIDTWFGGKGIGDTLVKPIAKHMVKHHMDKLDEYIDIFVDKDGHIKIHDILNEYHDCIPHDGLKLDPTEIFGNNFIAKHMDIKILEKSDIQELRRMLVSKGFN